MIERSLDWDKSEETAKYIPCIIVLAGPPLVGKTTIGRAIERRSNFKYLDVDNARIGLFGYQNRGTDEEERARMLVSYQQNHRYAEELLTNKIPVILGATYSHEKYHKLLRKLQRKTGFPLRVFILTTSDEELQKRVNVRKQSSSLSNVRDYSTAKRLKDQYVPISGNFVRIIDNSAPIENVVIEIQKSLGDLQTKDEIRYQ